VVEVLAGSLALGLAGRGWEKGTYQSTEEMAEMARASLEKEVNFILVLRLGSGGEVLGAVRMSKGWWMRMKQKLHCWGGTHKSLYPFPQGSHHITTCELSDSDNLEFPLSARVRSPPALRSLNYLACESSLLRVPHPGIVWSARCQY